MDLELTDEQAQLKAVAAELLDARAPLSLARSFLEGAGEPGPLWIELAELGWYDIGADPDDSDIGLPGLCAVAFEIGAHAAPSLICDTVLVARVGGPDRLEELPVAIAHLEASGSWGTDGLVTTFDGDRVDGIKLGVPHADRASRLAVTVESGDGPALVLVRPDDHGISITRETGLDPSGGACTVSLDGAAVEAELAGPGAMSALFEAGAIVTAAEALGAAWASMDMAIAYALERRQYGQTIGSFQALQHMLADCHVLRETAWSAVLYAAAATDAELDDAPEASAVAKARAARAARAVTETALQVLGGVAFTWEHDVHLLARRALSAERRFGDAQHHERRLGRDLVARAGNGTAAS